MRQKAGRDSTAQQQEAHTESYFAAKAVDLAHQQARALGLPRYYVQDGYLVEEKDGIFRKIKPIARNELYG